MPDITITIRAEDLASGEIQSLQKEIESLEQTLGGADQSAKSLQKKIEGLKQALGGADQSAKGFRKGISAIKSNMDTITSSANAVASKITGVGKGLVDAALKVEGFKASLANLEGDAAAAEKRFAELQKVAQLPGLSLEGAVQGAVHLKNIGLEAGLVDRVLKEFGNSLALVGGTDLSGALKGLTELVNKGKLTTQDLQQITSRAPQVAQALQSIFNTSNADEIQKQLDASGKSVKDFVNILVTELEKGARASGGPTVSAIGNLKDAIFNLKASLGETLLPAVAAVANVLAGLVNGINSLGSGTKTAIVVVGALVAGASALVGGFATLGVALAGIKVGLAALGVALAGIKVGLAALSISATAAGVAVKAALGPIGIVVAVVGGAIAAFRALTASKREAAKAAEELKKKQEQELQAIVAAANQPSGGKAVLDVQINVAKIDLETARKELIDLQTELDKTSKRSVGKRGKLRGEIDAQLKKVNELESAYTTLDDNRNKSETELNALAKEYLQTKRDQLQASLDDGNVSKDNIAKVVGQIGAINKALNNIKSVKVDIEVNMPKPEVKNFELVIVNLRHELDTLNDKLKNAANPADLKAAFNEAIAASKKLTQTRLEEIDASIAAAQAIINDTNATADAKANAAERIRGLQASHRSTEIAGEQQKTAIVREEAEKRKQIAIDEAEKTEQASREAYQNFIKMLEQNKPDLRLDFVHLEQQLKDVQDEMRNATSMDGLQAAYAKATAASEKYNQKRLSEIETEIENAKAAKNRLDGTVEDEAKANKKLADLQVQHAQAVYAAQDRETALKREHSQKQQDIAQQMSDNIIKMLEQNRPDFRLDLANLETQLSDVQDRLQNATSMEALKSAYAEAMAASEQLKQKRLEEIDKDLEIAQNIIDNEETTVEAKAAAEERKANLALKRRRVEGASAKEITAIQREEAQKQIDIATEMSEAYIKQLEENKPDLRLDLAKLENQFSDIENRLKDAKTPEELQAAFKEAIALSEQLAQTRLKNVEAEIKIAQKIIDSTKTTAEAKAEASKMIKDLELEQYQLEIDNEKKLSEITEQESEKRQQLRQEELSGLKGQIADTLAAVPTDLLDAAYESLVTIPLQTRDALRELSDETQTRIQELKESETLSAREKAEQIAQIEQDAAKQRVQIEKEANQAKIDGFKSVVDNFIGGIGQMIAEQIKLRAATALTNALLGSPGQSGGGGGGIGGILGSALPFLGALNPALAIGGGLALGAAALFSSSFDDPINDALARRAGIQASQRRASRAAVALGRRSAVDLRDNFEQGFVTETTRQTGAQEESSNPMIMNEIKLVIGSQELKAMYEETQRQITTGIIAR
ncbi:hypothetical protein J4G08_20615 [Candidatus Poribacteria bacterium]|nr:hypothetical protein [Candidatus Poribacteria bacterium]